MLSALHTTAGPPQATLGRDQIHPIWHRVLEQNQRSCLRISALIRSGCSCRLETDLTLACHDAFDAQERENINFRSWRFTAGNV